MLCHMAIPVARGGSPTHSGGQNQQWPTKGRFFTKLFYRVERTYCLVSVLLGRKKFAAKQFTG